MKAVYFPELPFNAESASARGRGPVMGSRVYLSGLFKALVSHCSYERLILIPRPPKGPDDPRRADWFAQHASKVESLHEHELHRLRDYDRVILMHWAANLDSMTRVRRLSRCPQASIVGAIHSLNHSSQLRGVFSLLVASLERHDALVCSSQAGRRAVQNFIQVTRDRFADRGQPLPEPKFKLPVIPLGVDVSDFSGPTVNRVRSALGLEQRVVVLYFGRLSAASKADLCPLILAFREVAQAAPNVALVIAGDDTHFNMTGVLEHFAQEVAPTAVVRVVANPDAETKRQLYAAADLFVSPSDNLQETFGISVIEAMASGLPVVASDWSGYKDTVIHGETGFRVPTMLPSYEPEFDDLRGSGAMLAPDPLAATTIVDVAAMTAAIRLLVDGPDLRRRMGEAGLRRARALYDWRCVIASYESLWDELAIEAASALRTESNDFDLEQIGYRDVFEHYPTGILDSSSAVRLAPFASTWPAWRDWIARIGGLDSFFDSTSFDRMVARLGSETEMLVGALIDDLADSKHSGRVHYMAHLSRLMKYGVVQLVVPQPSAPHCRAGVPDSLQATEPES
ncbi:MAG: glycosyltransferase family 4 protein [Cyanobacteria bacterium]|nr:glycosyltransferase family 4 protein [Cyanobacteriota bacterium]